MVPVSRKKPREEVPEGLQEEEGSNGTRPGTLSFRRCSSRLPVARLSTKAIGALRDGQSSALTLSRCVRWRLGGGPRASASCRSSAD